MSSNRRAVTSQSNATLESKNDENNNKTESHTESHQDKASVGPNTISTEKNNNKIHC